MKDEYEVYKVDTNNMNADLFHQIVEIENLGNEAGYSEETLKEIWMKSEKNDNFVCVLHGKIVGHISLNPCSKRRNGSVYCINLVVLPQYRRRGIAQTLIKAGCEYYLSHNCTLPFSLSVDKNNFKAISLYKKIGFEIKDPMSEIEKDDSQYIMVSTFEHVDELICQSQKKR